jgi:hypothetical protein
MNRLAEEQSAKVNGEVNYNILYSFDTTGEEKFGDTGNWTAPDISDTPKGVV